MIDMAGNSSKIFIIGLPRTGTTSLCALMLDLGYKTAHTAFTRYSFYEAEVIADTPVYCDYRQLDVLFPGSKFIYLDRAESQWLPSISRLLVRMAPRLARKDGFHPVMQRCFNTVFSPLTIDSAQDEVHLSFCYRRHREQVLDYFCQQPHRLLSVDIVSPNALPSLQAFLGLPLSEQAMPHLNQGKKIAQWQRIDHPNKVGSNLSGRGGRLFLEYFSD